MEHHKTTPPLKKINKKKVPCIFKVKVPDGTEV